MYNIWEGLPRCNWLCQYPKPTAFKAVIFSLWYVGLGKKKKTWAFKCVIQGPVLSLYSSKELKKTHSHKGSATPQAPAISAYSFLLCYLITRTDQFLFLCPIICKACKMNAQNSFWESKANYHTSTATVVLVQQSRGSICLCLKWSKLGGNCLVLEIQMEWFWRLEQSQQGSWLPKNQHSSRSCQEKCSCKITDRNFEN